MPIIAWPKVTSVFLGCIYSAMSSKKMRKRCHSSQTTETVHRTHGRTVGKKRKEDDPLTARDIPQIVQAVVDSLRESSSCTSGGGDNGITGADESPREPHTGGGIPIDG